MTTDAGQIVVANRASGSLSVIDAETDELLFTVPLPQEEGEEFPEPMYAIYLEETDEIAVGDRANDRLVVFNRSDYSVSALVTLGEGVFHSWADPDENQFWVTNDIDNTISVVDPSIKEVIATIPLDENLIAAGGKLHDVILDPVDDYAYVSVVGVEGETDVVIKYSTETFEEVDRVLVGDDPHLAATASNDVLYVPTQESNEVNILERETLDIIDQIPIPGAHGAVMVLDRETFDVFYTTNLPGEGTDALYAIDTETNKIIGEPVDAPFPVPHNVVLSAEKDKLFITHSGDNNQVSIYTLDEAGLPELSGSVTVGNNPFGLVTVAPSTIEEDVIEPIAEDVYRAQINDGTTSVTLDTELLTSAAGLTLTGAENTVAPTSEQFAVGFDITEGSELILSSDVFEPNDLTPIIGFAEINHTGTLTFSTSTDNIGDITVGDFTIGYDASRQTDNTSGFFLENTVDGVLPDGAILFDISFSESVSISDIDPLSGSVDNFGPVNLLVAPELATILSQTGLAASDLTGADVGDAATSFVYDVEIL